MLKKGDDMVVPKLNEYFPREGFEHPRGVSFSKFHSCVALSSPARANIFVLFYLVMLVCAKG